MTSPRGNETVLGQPIRVYDSGGSGDRYTVVYTDCKLGKHLGKRIPFAQLPEDCRKAVFQDLKGGLEK